MTPTLPRRDLYQMKILRAKHFLYFCIFLIRQKISQPLGICFVAVANHTVSFLMLLEQIFLRFLGTWATAANLLAMVIPLYFLPLCAEVRMTVFSTELFWCILTYLNVTSWVMVWERRARKAALLHPSDSLGWASISEHTRSRMSALGIGS